MYYFHRRWSAPSPHSKQYTKHRFPCWTGSDAPLSWPYPLGPFYWGCTDNFLCWKLLYCMHLRERGYTVVIPVTPEMFQIHGEKLRTVRCILSKNKIKIYDSMRLTQLTQYEKYRFFLYFGDVSIFQIFFQWQKIFQWRLEKPVLQGVLNHLVRFYSVEINQCRHFV